MQNGQVVTLFKYKHVKGRFCSHGSYYIVSRKIQNPQTATCVKVFPAVAYIIKKSLSKLGLLINFVCVLFPPSPADVRES